MNAAELKTIRLSLGVTAKYLADHVGVSERTIRNHESGEVRVSKAVADGIIKLEQSVDAAVFGRVKDLMCELNCPIEQETFSLTLNKKDSGIETTVILRMRQKLMLQGAKVTIDYALTNKD